MLAFRFHVIAPYFLSGGKLPGTIGTALGDILQARDACAACPHLEVAHVRAQTALGVFGNGLNVNLAVTGEPFLHIGAFALLQQVAVGLAVGANVARDGRRGRS